MSSVGIKGGDKMKYELSKRLKLFSKKRTLEVGFPAGTPNYPDGTPVAEVAFYNEYGTSTIPPRPFMRPTIEKNKEGWGVLLANTYKATKDIDVSFGVVGQDAVGAFREAIIDFEGEPNAPSTINKKGFATPLQDTGHMRDSVNYVIKKSIL